MIALDTNILIYAHRAGSCEHHAAQAAIERAARSEPGWGFAFSVVAEFWSQVTHPRYPGGPSTVMEASGFLEALAQAGARLWYPESGFAERLLQAAARMQVQGVRVFDLQIALTALDHGAKELWTHDAQFVCPPGLKLVDPLG